MAPKMGWHPEDIRSALRKRYGTIQAFAREVGYAPSTIADVLAGRFKPGAQLAIARTLKVKAHRLWPDHFGPGDVPLLGRAASKHENNNRENPVSRDESREAA